MLKFPTLAELVGLFFRSSRVDAALLGINRAIAHLQAVKTAAYARAEFAYADAERYRERARDAQDSAQLHQVEAQRATRVAARLEGIIA